MGNKEIIEKQRKERLGSEFINNKNVIGKCIEYINSANITVLLENGEICHTQWSNFSTGRFGTQRMNERLGEKNHNNQGLLMEIVKYNGKRDIDVKFKDGFISKNRRYDEFKNGQIKDLIYPSVFNIGYIGGEIYKVSKNGKITLEYNKWYGMLSRCYAENELSRFPTYIPCTVCNEWLNFQNFAEWLHENYYEIPNEIMCLDKDILFKRNKIYSPKTCCIVPDNINILFTKTDALRGEYPIGVSWHKEHNCFVSQMNRDGKLIHLGNFNNPIDAFNMYKKEKEKEIKRQANIYKKYLPRVSKWVVDYCVKHNIGTLVIGKNDGWKQKSDMHKVINQTFTQIPYESFLGKLEYKCKDVGIDLVKTEEAYTSGTSFLDGELPIKENYDKTRRVHRGLFRSNNGEYINADVNGAFQIMRKVFSNVKANEIVGAYSHPVIINL